MGIHKDEKECIIVPPPKDEDRQLKRAVESGQQSVMKLLDLK